MLISICSWNVRGLNDPSKRFVIRDIISKIRNAVVYLEESKVGHVSRSFLRSFAGSFLDKCVFLKSNGASGGLITCWNSRTFRCQEVIVRRYSIVVLLSLVNCGTRFYVTNVYGPTSWDSKEAFFSKLLLLKDCCKGKWVMCGDFNSTRGQHERNGKTWSAKETFLFNNLIKDLELIDLPMTNLTFTWSNLQRTPTLARLDRFLVSTEWDLVFPLSKVISLPRVASDHCPILLSVTKNLKRQTTAFQFEASLLNHEDFVSKLPGWWTEGQKQTSAVLTFTSKLRHCRNRIKKWCAKEFYSIREVKNKLMEGIQDIDKEEEMSQLS